MYKTRLPRKSHRAGRKRLASAISVLTAEHDTVQLVHAGVSVDEELYCVLCGIASGDIDEITGCEATFRLGYRDFSPNLRDERPQVMCSTCNEGARQIVRVKSSTISILSTVRRECREDQLEVLNDLLKRFSRETPP